MRHCRPRAQAMHGLRPPFPAPRFSRPPLARAHSQDVKFVMFHPTRDQLISASFDDTIKLWDEDGDDWECTETLQGHTSTVWCVSFEVCHSISPALPCAYRTDRTRTRAQRTDTCDENGGERMVSCGDDRNIIVWSRCAVRNNRSRRAR